MFKLHENPQRLLDSYIILSGDEQYDSNKNLSLRNVTPVKPEVNLSSFLLCSCKIHIYQPASIIFLYANQSSEKGFELREAWTTMKNILFHFTKYLTFEDQCTDWQHTETPRIHPSYSNDQPKYCSFPMCYRSPFLSSVSVLLTNIIIPQLHTFQQRIHFQFIDVDITFTQCSNTVFQLFISGELCTVVPQT